MSDFSELCPLFTTGVYSEVTFNYMNFSGLSTTNNAMVGALTAAKYPGSFKFQRTVVVTKIYSQKLGAGTQAVKLAAHRRPSTGTAAKTVFATCAWTSTQTKFLPGRVRAFTQASNKTFLAADVLGFGVVTKKTDPGQFMCIVRYKEK